MNIRRPKCRAGPIVVAGLSASILMLPSTLSAQSEPMVTDRCIPSPLTFEGATHEAFRQSLKEIEADLAQRKAEIEATAKAFETLSDSSGELVVANTKLATLSKAMDALKAQVRSASRASTTICNVKQRSKS